MDKLRQTLIAARQQVNHREEKQKAIVARLLPFLEGKNRIGIYMPIKGEVDIYTPLQKMDLELYAPCMKDRHQLEFRRAAAFQKAGFGILEPDQNQPAAPDLDVILVPLVGFSCRHRLGYGGGYYDRFLAGQSALTIGVAFDEQETCFEIQPWDVELDVLLTPTRTLGKKAEPCL